MTRPGARTITAIGLFSGSLLLFEITLTRIFSFTIWHHFASMVISVALLGFALSGVLLQLAPALGRPPRRRAGGFALLFALTAPAAVALLGRAPFDPTSLADQPEQLALLSLHYAVLLVPFTFAGLAVVCLLRGFLERASTLYASDLAGAGLGCVVAVAALSPLGAEGLILLAAGCAAGAAALLLHEAGPRRSFATAGAALLLVAAIPAAPWLLTIRPGPGKGLFAALHGDEKQGGPLLATRWNPLARVDAVDDLLPVPWTWNPLVGPEPPRAAALVLDGDASTPLFHPDAASASPSFLDFSLPSAALQAFEPGHVLVIGAGGGVDVLAALHHGARRVTAVEINPDVVELATGAFADRIGNLYARPEVSLHRSEGRAFVQSSDERYDLIQLSLIDTWAATASGAYSLAEGYLYTVEAFEDYLEHLADDGVLSITRWGWEPPREVLKLALTADAALRRRGIDDTALHVVVLGLPNQGNLLLKRTPFTAAEMARLRSVADERRFGFLLAPGLGGDNPFLDFFSADDPGAFLADYPFDVAPATDQSPFFFQFGRWRDAKLGGTGWRESMLALSGRLVLWAVLVQATLLSGLLLILPLARRGAAQAPEGVPSRARALAYFGLVGLGFMLAEIALMQRFTLFLGSPVAALALVLAALLLSAGAGSALAPRLAGRGRPLAVFAGITSMIVVHALAAPGLLRAGLALPGAARVALCLALVAPLGFLLGVPFPAALGRLQRAGAASLVGWAWAANGAASVIGPVVAVLLAMERGFVTTLLVAAVLYAASLPTFGPWWTATRH